MTAEIHSQKFLSPTSGVLSFGEVIENITAWADSGENIKISVGTDSEEIGSVAKFVSIILVWRIGRGANAFRAEISESVSLADRKGTSRFRDRIWREIILTAVLAQELRSALRDKDLNVFDNIEVHADVGENGGSSVMLREVIGVLKGYGFPDEFIKFKPEAYAASSVADHYI